MALNSVYVPFAQKLLPSVGVYAKVLRSGTIRRGDRVSVGLRNCLGAVPVGDPVGDPVAV